MTHVRTGVALRVGLVVACAALAAGDASAHRQAPAAWWTGLATPHARASARGVVALHPPVEGRVRIMGATFKMGSTTDEMQRAIGLCKREVLGPLFCDDGNLQNMVRAEGHAHDVTVFPFDLDRTEVTVRAYARCVEVGACAPAGFRPGDPRFDRPDLPVTHVRWDDASAYCAWVRGRLPTEAEWELAARGVERRAFPWGEVYNPRLANHGSLAEDETDATDGFAELAPVGSLPDGATPAGVQDLAGNAAEWVFDLWDTDENNFGYPETQGKPLVNPRGPQTGGNHVVRGGSYLDPAFRVRAAARTVASDHVLEPLLSPLSRSARVGFRCAYDP